MLICYKHWLELSMFLCRLGLHALWQISLQIEYTILKVVNLIQLLFMVISINFNLMPFLPFTILVVLPLILKIKPNAEVHSIIYHQFHIKIVYQLLEFQVEQPKDFFRVIRLVDCYVVFEVGYDVYTFH